MRIHVIPVSPVAFHSHLPAATQAPPPFPAVQPHLLAAALGQVGHQGLPLGRADVARDGALEPPLLGGLDVDKLKDDKRNWEKKTTNNFNKHYFHNAH